MFHLKTGERCSRFLKLWSEGFWDNEGCSRCGDGMEVAEWWVDTVEVESSEGVADSDGWSVDAEEESCIVGGSSLSAPLLYVSVLDMLML